MAYPNKKEKMRLLIRAYLSLKEKGTSKEISNYLNTYFNWNGGVTSNEVSKILQDTTHHNNLKGITYTQEGKINYYKLRIE